MFSVIAAQSFKGRQNISQQCRGGSFNISIANVLWFGLIAFCIGLLNAKPASTLIIRGLTVCVLASWHAPSKTFPNHKHLQNTLLKWNECLSKDMPFWHKCATPDGYEPLTGLTMWPLDALESHSRSLVRLDAKFQVKIEKKKTTSSHSPLLP